TRSCVGCNGRDGRSRMTRFMLVDGRLSWDLEGRRGGRGGYLHLDPKCVAAAAAAEATSTSIPSAAPRSRHGRPSSARCARRSRPQSAPVWSRSARFSKGIRIAKKSVAALLKELPGTDRKDVFAFYEKLGKPKIAAKTTLNEEEYERG